MRDQSDRATKNPWRQEPAGGIELKVGDGGEVELTSAALDRLHLSAGDLVSLEPGRVSLRIEIYREFLSCGWRGVPRETAWSYLEDFLRRPLSAVAPPGRLPIPPDLLALEAGGKAVLQIVSRGLAHELFLLKPVLELHG